MKLSITVLLVALFAVLGMAASSEKQVIISYPKGTPTSVMEEAMAEVRKAVSQRIEEHRDGQQAAWTRH